MAEVVADRKLVAGPNVTADFVVAADDLDGLAGP